MSLTFSGPYASPLPLILVGLLVAVFLLLESRRYRYFNVWRARCRLMETDVYGPMLRGEGVTLDGKWNTLLAGDYARPRSISATCGRSAGGCARTTPISWSSRRSPTTASSRSTRCRRAAWRPSSRAPSVGPLPGWFVVLAGVAFHGSWVVLAIVTYQVEKRYRARARLISM